MSVTEFVTMMVIFSIIFVFGIVWIIAELIIDKKRRKERLDRDEEGL